MKHSVAGSAFSHTTWTRVARRLVEVCQFFMGKGARSPRARRRGRGFRAGRRAARTVDIQQQSFDMIVLGNALQHLELLAILGDHTGNRHAGNLRLTDQAFGLARQKSAYGKRQDHG